MRTVVRIVGSAKPLGAHDTALSTISAANDAAIETPGMPETKVASRVFMSVLEPEAQAGDDGQIVRVGLVRAVVVVADAVDVALVVDVEHVEVRAELARRRAPAAPLELPRLVDAHVERVEQRQARVVGGVRRERQGRGDVFLW